MDANDLRSRFSKMSLGSVVKLSEAREKQRLISDVEFLSQEQYEFLEGHTQKKFFTFMENYWGEKMVTAGITCKTFEGTVINVDSKSIRVVDKRWKGASHCICGKAIRYEYWIGTYGPIGSIHICEHTNLDKTLVHDLTKGYKQQNELRTDIVKFLAELKEQNKTYDDWTVGYELNEKMKNLQFIRNPEVRNLIQKLCDLKLPLTTGVKRDLDYAQYLAKRSLVDQTHFVFEHLKVETLEEVKPNVEHVISAAEIIKAAEVVQKEEPQSPHSELLNKIEEVFRVCKVNNYRISKPTFMTLSGLQRAIKQGNPTLAQINYAEALVLKVKNSYLNFSSPDWQNIQNRARQVLAEIENNNEDSFAHSLYVESQKGDLSIKQLACVFGKEPVPRIYAECLYQKYLGLMNKCGIEKINLAAYLD
jgi:hypothetical protein